MYVVGGKQFQLLQVFLISRGLLYPCHSSLSKDGNSFSKANAISLSKKPDNVEKFKLKHISKSIDYHITHAQNIVNIFLENRVNQRSFAISDKRFIPPHQYEMAKKFLKEKNTI